MALNIETISTNANNDYYNSFTKAKLNIAFPDGIPASAEAEAKAGSLAMIQAITKAIVDNIQSDAETKVTTAVNGIITAIKGAVVVPMDGGASLKATIIAALPTTVSNKID
jgi:hypothetical protein